MVGYPSHCPAYNVGPPIMRSMSVSVKYLIFAIRNRYLSILIFFNEHMIAGYFFFIRSIHYKQKLNSTQIRNSSCDNIFANRLLTAMCFYNRYLLHK